MTGGAVSTAIIRDHKKYLKRRTIREGQGSRFGRRTRQKLLYKKDFPKRAGQGRTGKPPLTNLVFGSQKRLPQDRAQSQDGEGEKGFTLTRQGNRSATRKRTVAEPTTRTKLGNRLCLQRRDPQKEQGEKFKL